MEKWDLLDGDGRPLGQTLVRGDKLRPGQYHLVVHIWVEDSKGRLLIQKRAPHLKLMPDTWAVTGGSALAGETDVFVLKPPADGGGSWLGLRAPTAQKSRMTIPEMTSLWILMVSFPRKSQALFLPGPP